MSKKLETITAEPPAATTPDPLAPKTAPKPMLVLDTTATDASGPRTHEQVIKGVITPFTFKPGQPLPLPVPTALKFLKHEAFVLVNDKGERQPFQRRPKQPEELGAGEIFKLADDETVARYDEIATDSLLHRVIEMPGGEQFAARPSDRKGMIAFIKNSVAAMKKANTVDERDSAAFVPEADLDDEADAA